MKYLFVLFFAVLIITSCQEEKAGKENFRNLNDSLSYVAGNELGFRYKQYGYEINPELLKQGLIDGMADTNIFSKEDVIAVRARMRRKQEKKMEEESAANQVAGKKFLENAKMKDSVVVLDSGMVYKILRNGEGRSPKLSDNVSMLLEVKSTDGKVLFTNFGKDPIVKEVETNILGIQLALKKMHPGEVWQLYLSPDFAYGIKGYPPYVAPQQYLELKLALIQVMPKKSK